MLIFVGHPSIAYQATGFRKIKPDAAEGEESDLVRRIRECRPKVPGRELVDA